MKKFLTLLAVVALTYTTKAQDDKDLYMTKPLSSENIKNIKARTSGGSINVSGGAGDARIEVYIRGNNSRTLTKEEIKRRLDENYTLTVTASGGNLTAIAEQKHNIRFWDRDGLSISFKIFVPQSVSTDLATSGGSIHLDNLAGTQVFRTSGGSLHMDKLSGKIDGRTSGGSIHIKESKDDIDLHTSGGSVHADNCTGNITLATSGGSVRLNELQGTIKAQTSGGSVHGDNIKGDLSAHTSGGRVDLKGLAGSVDASTSGGGMSVELTELGKYVTISNSGGNIDVTMPGNKGIDLKLRGEKVKTNTLNNFSGRMEEDEINGQLNGGGIPVSIRTSSGRVNLTLK